jgi:hypothetical protein
MTHHLEASLVAFVWAYLGCFVWRTVPHGLVENLQTLFPPSPHKNPQRFVVFFDAQQSSCTSFPFGADKGQAA